MTNGESATFSPVVSVPSKDDIDYAEYFVDVAAALEGTVHSEAIALRLSTCRNIYLTINAVFVDLRLILGHGRSPSSLSSAIECARRFDYGRADGHLNKVRAVLSQINDKLACWEKREELDIEFARSVGELDIIAQDRLNLLFRQCRTSNARTGHHWDPKYYDLASAEPAGQLELLRNLIRTSALVEAVTSTLRCIAALQRRWREGEELYASDAGKLWGELINCIRDNAGLLGVSVDKDSCRLEPDGADDLPLTLTGDPPPNGDGAVAGIVARLAAIERQQYEYLVRAFRGNKENPPLPPPFVVDLRESQLSETHAVRDGRPQITHHDIGQRIPNSARLAVLDCGIPADWYNERDFRYTEDRYREEVATLTRAAVVAATRARAHAIVFPEFYLPRFVVDEIRTAAREAKLVLITGLEGTLAGGELMNSVAIEVPGHPSIEQTKQGPSNYETSDFFRSPRVHVFERSSIGTFAVISCSDLLEWDVISTLASARTMIDLLVVCAVNPYPNLYETLARADAVRLYCNVVIANNCPVNENGVLASSRGTGCWSPRRVLDEVGVEHIDIGVPDIGGQKARLSMLAVPLGEVRRNRIKPAKEFLPVPRCRVSVRIDGASDSVS